MDFLLVKLLKIGKSCCFLLLLADLIYISCLLLPPQIRFLHCLSSEKVRQWCIYEWFYSAIDVPWFSRNEFVEYLNHAGLGHVPRLTRAEWGVIRGYGKFFFCVYRDVMHQSLSSRHQATQLNGMLPRTKPCGSLGLLTQSRLNSRRHARVLSHVQTSSR